MVVLSQQAVCSLFCLLLSGTPGGVTPSERHTGLGTLPKEGRRGCRAQGIRGLTETAHVHFCLSAVFPFLLHRSHVPAHSLGLLYPTESSGVVRTSKAQPTTTLVIPHALALQSCTPKSLLIVEERCTGHARQMWLLKDPCFALCPGRAWSSHGQQAEGGEVWGKAILWQGTSEAKSVLAQQDPKCHNIVITAAKAVTNGDTAKQVFLVCE